MSPTTAEMAPGEVARGLSEVKEALRNTAAELNNLAAEVRKNPDWEDLRRSEKALEQRIIAEETMRKAERKVADTAIKSLQDWNKWAVRTVGGLVITAVAAVVLTGTVPG